jgi:hypothetical protein
MDRNIVYPGAIPLDVDLLSINQNTMVALGFLIRATLGTSIAFDGFECVPTVPGTMSVKVGPGSMIQLQGIDQSPFGTLPAQPDDPIMKMGINRVSQVFDIHAPAIGGDSVNYLIQARFQENDAGLTVLSYYNASNPSQPYSGPTNSGQPQATLRRQTVQLQLKAGGPSASGTQLTPSPDPGWTGLYAITASYGQSVIAANEITTLPTAPFLTWKIPTLRPGFGSGVRTFLASGVFVVPAGVSQIEVELWGGGSGSFASTAGVPSGGGSGGGYARKRIGGLTPGQTISVTVGMGGTAGRTNGTAAGAGGATSFGQYCSATGGGLNYFATTANPPYGATPPGVGIEGDVNLTGSAGQASILNQGGMGGGSPMGGQVPAGVRPARAPARTARRHTTERRVRTGL